jgi:ACS family hexuronate transporter-like MFS transporter
MGLNPETTEPRAATGLGRAALNYRWWVCALLFLATTINYIDRQILSLLKPILDEQLKWTNEQFGLVNSAFQGAYAVGLLGFGWFIDRFGTKVGYAVSIAAWSLAALGHALVGSFHGFFCARLALGLGEGGNFPSAIKAVTLWFSDKERAFATSIFNSGTNVGALLAPALVPWIALTWGWRAAFIAAGLAGFLWLFLWIPSYRTPGRGRALASRALGDTDYWLQAHGPDQKIPWARLLPVRQLWSFVIAKFLTDPVWWFFLIWLPDYFKRARDLDLRHSWPHLVTIYAIVTVLSILGGWVTGHVAQRGWSVTRARKTGMFVFALCALPILYATNVGPWGAVVLIGFAAAAHQAWSANLFTTVSDMFPANAVASVIGLGGMAGSVGGMLFPWAAGRLLDNFTRAGNLAAGYRILFGVCGCAYVVAWVLNHLCAPRFEPLSLGPLATKR